MPPPKLGRRIFYIYLNKKGGENVDKFNLVLSSNVTEISDYKTYTTLIDRVCYFDEPNYNKCKIPYDDTTDEKIHSLELMPVQAKYVMNENGEPDLGSHEVTIGENGEIKFGTESIGVHTRVWVQKEAVTVTDGTVKELPCLYSELRIWNRYENYISAIKRLYANGGLHNSWEISVMAYDFADGIKTLKDYLFEGNCLLGSNVEPAYPSAAVLDMASIQKDNLMCASALAADIAAQRDGGKEEEMKKTKTTEISTEETVTTSEETEVTATEDPIQDTSAASEEQTAEPEATASDPETSAAEPEVNPVAEPETSSVTINDLYESLNNEVHKMFDDRWCYVAFCFPEDHIVWVKCDGQSELEFTVVTYTVNEDGSIVLGEPSEMSLTVSAREINSVISEKDAAIVAANEEVESLKAQVAELEPFKTEAEKAAAEKAEAEKTAKISALQDKAAASKQFTKDELASEEFAEMFNALDEAKLNSMIAERVIAKQRPEKETSAKPAPVVKADLAGCETTDDSEKELSAKDRAEVVRNFLRK